MNIVFDFGAVLFTWQPAVLLARHFPQHTATAEAAQQFVQDIFHHDDWQCFDRGTVELEDVISRTSTRMELAHPTLHGMMTVIGERLEPIACNIDLLARLRRQRDEQGDVKLYFLSNMPVPYARTLEQRHEFLQWFDGGIFSGDVKLGKPDPAIYELLAARHGLKAEETIFIDDTLANVRAAQALGWQAIHCRQPELLEGQLAESMALLH